MVPAQRIELRAKRVANDVGMVVQDLVKELAPDQL